MTEILSSDALAGRLKTGSQQARRGLDTHLPGEYLWTPGDVAAYLNSVIEQSAGDPALLMKASRSWGLRDLRAGPDSAEVGTA